MIDDTEGCLRKSSIKNNPCCAPMQAWVLMLQWLIVLLFGTLPPHRVTFSSTVVWVQNFQGHGITLIFNLVFKFFKFHNNKGKETLRTGAASNVAAVLSHCQSWGEMVLTKTFNIGKKPLESEHRVVHIFKVNLFPVRIGLFPLTLCNYLPLIQLPLSTGSQCPIPRHLVHFKPLTISHDLIKHKSLVSVSYSFLYFQYGRGICGYLYHFREKPYW